MEKKKYTGSIILGAVGGGCSIEQKLELWQSAGAIGAIMIDLRKNN